MLKYLLIIMSIYECSIEVIEQGKEELPQVAGIYHKPNEHFEMFAEKEMKRICVYISRTVRDLEEVVKA